MSLLRKPVLSGTLPGIVDPPLRSTVPVQIISFRLLRICRNDPPRNPVPQLHVVSRLRLKLHQVCLAAVLLGNGGDRTVKEAADDLRIRVRPEDDTHPVASLHAEGKGQPGDMDLRQALPPALDIRPLQLRSTLPVPLTHEKSSPLARAGLCQNRKAGKVSPLMLLLYMVFLPGVGRQFRQLQALLSSC